MTLARRDKGQPPRTRPVDAQDTHTQGGNKAREAVDGDGSVTEKPV